MKRLGAPLLVLSLLIGCREEPRDDVQASNNHEQDVLKWRADRRVRLIKEDGWLSLVGLDWLAEGMNPAGKLPAAFELKNGVVTMTPSPNSGLTIKGQPVSAPVVLADDTATNGPTVVQRGTMRFNVIKRNDKYGLRIKDADSPARTHFLGLDYFPVNPKWRVEARFEPYNPPKKVPITNVMGMVSDETAPGQLVFDVDGKTYRIEPILEQGETDLFIIFRDQTAGHETYGAARYLYAHPPGPDGKTVVDFNKSYNPPCAFTPYATCPLPPPQNRLPVRIEAGEKKYAGSHA